MTKQEEKFFLEQLGRSFEDLKKEADTNSSGNYSTSASSGDFSTSASSGYSSTSASSGDSSKSASSGDYSTSASSGDYSTSASSGYSSTSASSGYSSKSASSGDSSKSASSGDFSTSASSGDSSTSASSGNYSTSASSGDFSTSASSGDYSTSASSGYSSTSECEGGKSCAVSVGYWSKVKGKTKGALIGATEYDKDRNPVSIAFGVIGKDLKENTWYLAYKGKLVEAVEVDGIRSGLIHKRGNVLKVVNPNMKEGYIVTNSNGVSAHGKTIKEARESLIYKASNRDLSELEYLTEETELSFNDAIEAYHSITGACSQGMKIFIESNNLKRESYKVSEMIDLTKDAYGHERFKEFINKIN